MITEEVTHNQFPSIYSYENLSSNAALGTYAKL